MRERREKEMKKGGTYVEEGEGGGGKEGERLR